MSTEEIIIAIWRIVGSLPVLWWPFWGGIFAILVDGSDVFLRNTLGVEGVERYHTFDKLLDQFYMFLFLVVAMRWSPVPRNIAVVLYVFRVTGVIIFEITGERDALWLFPNLFEFWFVFVAGLQHFGLEARQDEERVPWLFGLLPFRYTGWQVTVAMVGVAALKLPVEYVLHTKAWFDEFSAFEAVEWIWDTAMPPW
jgi:hypothetical protein